MLMRIGSYQLLESLKKSLPHRFKADWRKYVQAMALLALISVESFYFQGANISLLVDAKLLSRPSLNDAVDSMFAGLNQEALKPNRSGINKKELASLPGRQNPNRPLLEKPAIPAPVTVLSELPQRLPVSSPDGPPSSAPKSEIETNMALVHVPLAHDRNVTEPVRTAQNTTLKSGLNVKWEN